MFKIGEIIKQKKKRSLTGQPSPGILRVFFAFLGSLFWEGGQQPASEEQHHHFTRNTKAKQEKIVKYLSGWESKLTCIKLLT